MKQDDKEKNATSSSDTLSRSEDRSEKEAVKAQVPEKETAMDKRDGDAAREAPREKEASSREEKKGAEKNKNSTPGRRVIHNNLREFRIEQMMSKAELARKAGLSVLTIDRIEKGYGCRMDTKRKILKALGLKLSDRLKVFKEE